MSHCQYLSQSLHNLFNPKPSNALYILSTRSVHPSNLADSVSNQEYTHCNLYAKNRMNFLLHSFVSTKEDCSHTSKATPDRFGMFIVKLSVVVSIHPGSIHASLILQFISLVLQSKCVLLTASRTQSLTHPPLH